MSARTVGEAERTRANLLQVGTIAEADYARARVRVLMAGLTSAWLPWLAARAGGDRAWVAPELGEQVLVACPDGDPASGVVLGAIYQASAAAPAASPDITRTIYADGAVIEYDRAAHALRALLPAGGTAALVATGGVSITGDVALDGDLAVSGRITSDGDQIAAGISAAHHTHGGVEPGNGTTGEPVA